MYRAKYSPGKAFELLVTLRIQYLLKKYSLYLFTLLEFTYCFSELDTGTVCFLTSSSHHNEFSEL